MRILISGANGFIGQYVTRTALLAGHEVVAIGRKPPVASDATRDGLQWVEWDLTRSSTPPLHDLGIDAAIHLAAAMSGSLEEQRRTTITGTENFLRGLRTAGVKRLVGISSLSVIDYARLKPMTTVDENSQICDAEPQMGNYAYTKALQERLFQCFAQEEGTNCTILRPGLVYERDALPIAYAGICKKGCGFTVSHAGEVPIVEVATVAHAVLASLDANLESGEILQLVDDGLPGQSAYIRHLKHQGHLPNTLVPIPWSGLYISLGKVHGTFATFRKSNLLPQFLRPQAFASRFKPFRYANEKAKRLLGWQPETFGPKLLS